MSTSRWLIWLLLALVLGFLTFGVESCSTNDGWADILCGDCELVNPKPVDRYAFDFKHSDANVNFNTDKGWDKMKASILAGGSAGDTLVITGPYFDGETEQMGLDRAAKIAAQFGSDYVIVKRAKKYNCSAACKDGTIYHPGEANYFSWIAKAEAPTEVAEIVREDKCTIIRFPYDSSKGQYSNAVMDELKSIAARAKESGETVTCVGHTDVRGNADYNKNLGQQRASDVRRILRNNGVASGKVTASSQGESSPLDTGDTEAAHQKNRRVLWIF